jgi:hypothetical protein
MSMRWRAVNLAWRALLVRRGLIAGAGPGLKVISLKPSSPSACRRKRAWLR